MTWTSAEDIRKQLERLWKHGDLLRALIGIGFDGPIRLRASVPSAHETALDFGSAQEWVATMRALPCLRIEWEVRGSRVLAKQPLPKSLWIDTASDAVSLLGLQAEASRYVSLHAKTREVLPALTVWVEQRPLRALALAQIWTKLLQVVLWQAQRDAALPMYVRQAAIPGIDSKFIEQHGPLLSELFAIALPGKEEPMSEDFRVRHGFLVEPVRIRFRFLYSNGGFAGLPGCPDVELDETSFAALALPIRRVFMVENKTTFLAFPPVAQSILVFGAGYGMRALGRAVWLHRVPLYYWGDLDTHGFAILAQVRAVFPHVQSFLMDKETLLSHEEFWVTEESAVAGAPEHLAVPEREAYAVIKDATGTSGVRLEQERIAMSTVAEALDRLLQQEQSQLSPAVALPCSEERGCPSRQWQRSSVKLP